MYVRELEDISWIIDVQKSQWNTKEKAEFTLNCGVYVPGLFAAYGNRPEPETPSIGRCCLQARIGALTDGKDRWWVLHADDDIETTDEKIGAEIRDRLEHGVLPFLERFQSRRDLAAYLEAWGPREQKQVMPKNEVIVLAYLGILYWLLGEQEKCRSMLAQAAEKAAKKPNEELIHDLRARLG
jgi:hypothetical protein